MTGSSVWHIPIQQFSSYAGLHHHNCRILLFSHASVPSRFIFILSCVYHSLYIFNHDLPMGLVLETRMCQYGRGYRATWGVFLLAGYFNSMFYMPQQAFPGSSLVSLGILFRGLSVRTVLPRTATVHSHVQSCRADWAERAGPKGLLFLHPCLIFTILEVRCQSLLNLKNTHFWFIIKWIHKSHTVVPVGRARRLLCYYLPSFKHGGKIPLIRILDYEVGAESLSDPNS